MTLDFQVVLGLSQHRSNHLSQGSVQKFIGQVDDLFGYSVPNQELWTLIGEVVAIVLKYIVCSLSESRLDFFKEFHEELFRKFSEAKIDNFSGSPYIWLTNLVAFLPKGVRPGAS